MARKIKSYVDTGAFIAFLDRSDTYHSKFLKLFEDPPSLVTTPLVIAEGHGWFLKRYDRFRALQFLNFIEDLKVLRIIEVGKVALQESVKILRKYSDQSLTLADACGLYIMKNLNIKVCWSVDHQLSLTGVPLVIHEK